MTYFAEAPSAEPSTREANWIGRFVDGAFDTRLFFLCLPLALVLLALVTAPAQAAPETVAGFGEGAGQVWGPEGVAVDRSTGDLYVADRVNFRVDNFDSEGHFSLAWGLGVRDGQDVLRTRGPQAVPATADCLRGRPSEEGGLAPVAVALDEASDAVYVANDSSLTVRKFTTAGEFLFTVGKDVNLTKVGEGAPQQERNICTAASGDSCGPGFGAGNGPNEFERPESLAVDSVGTVWIGDTERIASFDSSGNPGAEIALPGAGATRSLALDSADNFYVVSESLPGVRKLEAGTGTLLETLDEAGFPSSVTLDGADNVYVGDCGGPAGPGSFCPTYHFNLYNAAGEQTHRFGDGEVIGAPEGNALAVGESAGKALHRQLEGLARDPCRKRAPGLPPARAGAADREAGGRGSPADHGDPAGEDQSREPRPPTTSNTGPARATARAPRPRRCRPATSTPKLSRPRSKDWSLTRSTTSGSSPPATATPPNPPKSARLSARTAPSRPCRRSQSLASGPPTSPRRRRSCTRKSTALGAEAEAWIEYGTDEGYGAVVPLANLGDGFGAVERQAALDGLQPNTTYHYRFVGRDERDGTTYTVPGPDRTFTTQFGGIGFPLPDNRAWEMVSPPDKHGGSSSSAPNRRTGKRRRQRPGLLRLAPPRNRSGRIPRILDQHGPARARRILVLGRPRHAERRRSARSRARTEANTSSSLPTSPRRCWNRAAARRSRPKHRSGPLTRRENSEPPLFRPLVTDKEGFGNVPPGTGFGGEAVSERALSYVRIQAATPDLSHVVLDRKYRSGPKPRTTGSTDGSTASSGRSACCPRTRAERWSKAGPAPATPR